MEGLRSTKRDFTVLSSIPLEHARPDRRDPRPVREEGRDTRLKEPDVAPRRDPFKGHWSEGEGKKRSFMVGS